MAAVIQADRTGRPHDPTAAEADAMRRADAAQLEVALGEGRTELLALFDGFEAVLSPHGLRIAFDPSLNLPLWELGHIGWFEEWWIGRNQDRARGIHFDAALPRAASLLTSADACYDSANVPHAGRWDLSLPDAGRTRAYLAAVRAQTTGLLREAGSNDDALYFFRLVMFHEDMHREAWLMMAQQLGLQLGAAGAAPTESPAFFVVHDTASAWVVNACTPGRLGPSSAGFVFDNELAPPAQVVERFEIDRQPITWQRFLPFIEAGGYADESLWSATGWRWRQQRSDGLPLHLRRGADGWECRCFGSWRPLDLRAAAVHLSAFEAAAWCRFAGRRLPTEFEWEAAALQAPEQGERFDWGRVWEWTASPFAPYPGFTPHPYREYSAPFFDGRPVLRGGSWATAPRMRHPRYRNYFGAERNDVFAGFRSCAFNR